MNREEEIKKKSEVGSRKTEVGRQKTEGRSRKTEVVLHSAYCGVKLSSGVLSLSSGRSTNLPEAKYHLVGGYAKVAHGVLSLSPGRSTTQSEAKYHLNGGYAKVAHGVLSLSSGRSTNLPEAKYGSEADCNPVSRQLSDTMFDISTRLAVQNRLAPGVLTNERTNNNLTIYHFNNLTISQFNNLTIYHFNNLTISQFNNLTINQFDNLERFSTVFHKAHSNGVKLALGAPEGKSEIISHGKKAIRACDLRRFFNN